MHRLNTKKKKNEEFLRSNERPFMDVRARQKVKTGIFQLDKENGKTKLFLFCSFFCHGVKMRQVSLQ